MSDYQEPSYYEIALTNRQVLVAFVILLAALVGSFFAGVRVGRGPAAGPAPSTTDMVSEAVAPSGPQELEFFVEEPDEEDAAEEQTAGQSAPAGDTGSSLAAEPAPVSPTTLAEDLGAAPPGETRRGESEPAEPEEEPPTRAERPAQVAPATPIAVADDSTLIIQVFSTRDEEQATRLVNRLQAGGFEAFLSPIEADRATMYRVRIGPFQSRPEAEKVAAQVREKYRVDTWITSP